MACPKSASTSGPVIAFTSPASVRTDGEYAVSAKYAPFDVAEYLDNDAVIAEYLAAAIEDPNPDVFLAALGDVAKARGMAQIAKETGLGRESLYKALSSGAHPRYETIKAVLNALGVRLSVVLDHPG
jgi:probable addiction module antidote protein